MTVNVATGIIHYDLLQKAQLVLTYGPYRQNIELTLEKPEHRLVVRPEPGVEALLRTEGTLVYKDGALVPLPPHDWKPQELLVINEPRENMLRVRVILADPGHEYERARVRLRYEHGNRLVEQPLELTTHAQIEEWAVRLEDPTAREWKYEATLVKKSGDIDTVPWTNGKSDQLILGVQAVDVLPIQVAWLVVPPDGNLLAVKIDLLYEDERSGLRWDHSELIRQGHTGSFLWSVPIADAKKRTYRYRVTEFPKGGGQKESPWQESDTEMLVLLPSS